MKRRTMVVAGLVALLLVAAVGAFLLVRDSGGDAARTQVTRQVDGLTITEDPEADPEDPDFLSLFVPDDLALPVERLVEMFKETQPEVVLQLTTGGREQLQQRLSGEGAPHLYIDTPEELAGVDVADAGSPIELGSDVVQIVVARDNPRGVPGLEAFAGGEWTSGLCTPGVLCGELGGMVLEAAGIEPAPDRTADDGVTLVSFVRDGEVDAVLVLRSAQRMRFRATSAVGVPEEYEMEVDYAMLPVRDGLGIDRFTEFLESPEGERALGIVGLRPIAS